MDDRTLQAIEYPGTLGLIAERCISAPARRAALGLRPADEAWEVRRLLDETGEASGLAESGERIPLAAFEDPAPWFEEIRARGGVLEPLWLLEILSLLSTAADVSKYLEGQRDVVLFLVEQHLSRHILETIAREGRFDEDPGSGIAFQIDIEDAVGLTTQIETIQHEIEDQI